MFEDWRLYADRPAGASVGSNCKEYLALVQLSSHVMAGQIKTSVQAAVSDNVMRMEERHVKDAEPGKALATCATHCVCPQCRALSPVLVGVTAEN